MSDATVSYEALLFAGVSYMAFEYYKCYKNYLKYETAYWSERRGRAQVEREMKRISNIQLNTSEGFFVQPIGHIESCYRHCIGTPRQGMLVPESRATLKLTTNMSPEALVGLENFSHVWISFKFHLNTNTLKESKAFSKGSTFTAKISLPMLKGTQKIGVLATRSPHRPNPIGITLAQVDRVDKKNRTVYLKACDLVNGTPVLDVKPYVPAYDTVPDFRIPPWLSDTVFTRNTVTVDKKCYDQVKRIQGSLYQYKNDPDMFMKALIETLEAEVRSRFQTDRRMQDSKREMMVEVLFDEAVVKYNWPSERVFEVLEIELQSESKTIAAEAQKLRLDDDQKAAAASAAAAAAAGENGAEGEEVDEEDERAIPLNSELSF